MSYTAVGYVLVFSNSDRTWIGSTVHLTEDGAKEELLSYGYIKAKYEKGYLKLNPEGLQKADLVKVEITT